jgi:D-tagatose-1,6-bisphosphate aldolase subunit GatZ/KbaZ
VSGHETPAGTRLLLDMVAAQKRGEARGVYSICSANRFALEAGMAQAAADGRAVLIESTSNQVNQLGGYTGTTPEGFVAFVAGLAARMGLPKQRVVLGGDHLGPHPWRAETSAVAMERAREMVRQYVRSGFVKIHLDASMRLGDDPTGRPPDEALVAERAAELAAVAEATERPRGTDAPVYVIGREVPIPGGETDASTAIAVTRPDDAQGTIDLARAAFRRRGLESAWERVIAIVVQPGVDFADATVVEYDRRRAAALKALAERQERLVYEAHSTDYQTAHALRELVEDHFAILKVGPALTFAVREAVFALASIEREWLGGRRGLALSDVPGALEAAMQADPTHWRPYYRGNEDELRFARRYSLSDRVRYYWPKPEVQAALDRLIQNLTAHPPPLSLVSQHLPNQYRAIREGGLGLRPEDMIRAKALEVAEVYARACGGRTEGS